MELLNVRSFVFSCMLLISIYNQHEEYTNEEYANSLSNRIMNTSLVSSIENFIGYRNPSTVKHTNHRGYHTLLYLSFLLLLNTSDVETNPGPRAPKHPRQICKSAVTWKQRGVARDDCSQWYHAECMHITSPVYKALNNPNISWHCVNCGMPNFSTSLFESFMVNMSNTYDHLSDSNLPDSPGQPIFTSSSLKPLGGENGRSNYNKPRNTKILVINFQCKK